MVNTPSQKSVYKFLDTTSIAKQLTVRQILMIKHINSFIYFLGKGVRYGLTVFKKIINAVLTLTASRQLTEDDIFKMCYIIQ